VINRVLTIRQDRLALAHFELAAMLGMFDPFTCQFDPFSWRDTREQANCDEISRPLIARTR